MVLWQGCRTNGGAGLCSPVVNLQEGQLVTPALRLRRLLGKGGMGSVWLADQLALQTQVAVKFLSPEMTASPDAIERFKREATAAAQIRSPHVVQTLDHGLTSEGVPYIVLELLEGEELGARMEREPRLPVPLVALIVSQTCKALSKAHSLSIVHRDIKPDNIYLVDVDGEPFVKVLDFGIAKKTDEASLKMTSTNAIIGTPYYMSPEQAFSSKSVDARADLWALAVVAYFALVGDVPFNGETVGAICLAIDRAKYRPVTELRPELPASLDDWFARAFARNIEKRFGSAREMADAFAVAVGEELSGPASTVLPSRRLSAVPSQGEGRSRLLLPAILVGVFLALGGGLAIGISSRDAAPAAPSASAAVASAPRAISSPVAPAASVSSAPAEPPVVPAVSAASSAPAPAGSSPRTPARSTGKPPAGGPPATPPVAPPSPPSPPAAPTSKDRGFLFFPLALRCRPPGRFPVAGASPRGGRAHRRRQGDRPFPHGRRRQEGRLGGSPGGPQGLQGCR